MSIVNWMKKHVITRYMMTNGCPDQAKCFEILELVLDQEGTPDDEAHFKIQMDSCWQCFQKYQLDRAVKDLVRNKMEKKEVPEELIDEIRSQINKLH